MEARVVKPPGQDLVVECLKSRYGLRAAAQPSRGGGDRTVRSVLSVGGGLPAPQTTWMSSPVEMNLAHR